MATYTRYDLTDQEVCELELFDAIRVYAKEVKDMRNPNATRAFLVSLSRCQNLDQLGLEVFAIQATYTDKSE